MQSPDLLNVELSKAGTLRKRDGFVSYLTGYSTVAVSSSFYFKNQAGNEIVLFANGTDIWRSANGGVPTVLTTMTYGARLACANAEGTAYCFTSSNDQPWSYDGTTRTDLKTLSYPNGKFSIFTKDRELVAGTTDQPNRLLIGKSGAYTNFTGGNNIVDSWYENVGTNGDRITALAYLNGRVIVFKELSIVGFNVTDQFNSVMYGIASDVGTAGPESLIQRAGVVYFKGTDNEFYAIDGSPGGINRLSTVISSTTASLFAGKNRYNIQTDKPDWDAGNLFAAGPGAVMRTDIVAGSVMGSSATLVDTSAGDFSSGTLSGLTTSYAVGSIRIATAAFAIPNGDFETGTLASWFCYTQTGADICAVNTAGKISGTYGAQVEINCSPGPFAANVNLLEGGTTVYTLAYPAEILTGTTIDLVALGLSTRTLRMNFDISANNSAEAMLTSSTFTAISSITWSGGSAGNCPGFPGWGALDDIKINRYYDVSQSSGIFQFHSRVFDTGVSTTIGGTFSVTVTSAAAYAPLTFQVRSASSSYGVWGAWTSLSTANPVNTTQEFWQWQSSFTISATTGVAPQIDDVTLIAATTGQYVTQCIEPGPGISAWGLINAGGATTGGAGLSYEMQTGNSCSALGAFASISTGAVPGVSAVAALKIRTTFSLPSATNTARLDELTVNWSDGSVSSPTYGAYWNDGLYWSVQTSTGGNNRVLKYDLLHDEWFVFDLAANPLMTFNSNLYFGSSYPPGKMYRFSNPQPSRAPTSDDGAAINAYWRSKNFTGVDPFVENSLDGINLVMKKQDGGSASITWRANGGDTGSGTYSVNLSTGTNAVRSNYRTPAGTRGTFFSLQVGNTSTTPFEILGARIDFKPLPYRPLP